MQRCLLVKPLEANSTEQRLTATFIGLVIGKKHYVQLDKINDDKVKKNQFDSVSSI